MCTCTLDRLVFDTFRCRWTILKQLNTVADIGGGRAPTPVKTSQKTDGLRAGPQVSRVIVPLGQISGSATEISHKIRKFCQWRPRLDVLFFQYLVHHLTKITHNKNNTNCARVILSGTSLSVDYLSP